MTAMGHQWVINEGAENVLTSYRVLLIRQICERMFDVDSRNGQGDFK
jgi:hypothetical protein